MNDSLIVSATQVSSRQRDDDATSVDSNADIAKLHAVWMECTRRTLYAGRLCSPETYLKFVRSEEMLMHVFMLGKSRSYDRKVGGKCFTTPIFMKHGPPNGASVLTQHPMMRIGSRAHPMTTTFPLTEMFDVSESEKKLLNECSRVKDVDKILEEYGVNGLKYDVSITGGIRAAHNMDAFKLATWIDALCITAQAQATKAPREELVKQYVPLFKPEFEEGLTDTQKKTKVYPDPLDIIKQNAYTFDATAYFKIRMNFTDPESPLEDRKSKRIAPFRTQVKVFEGVDPETGEDKYKIGSYRDLLNFEIRNAQNPYRLSFFVDGVLTTCETTIDARFRGVWEAAVIYIVPNAAMSDGATMPEDLPFVDASTATNDFLSIMQTENLSLFDTYGEMIKKTLGVEQMPLLENGKSNPKKRVHEDDQNNSETPGDKKPKLDEPSDDALHTQPPDENPPSETAPQV